MSAVVVCAITALAMLGGSAYGRALHTVDEAAVRANVLSIDDFGAIPNNNTYEAALA